VSDLLNDLNAELRDLKRRIRVLESASPLGWSSVSEGALEIRSAEGLIVVGSARISGVLNGDGTFDWTGPATISGTLNVTGATTLAGAVTMNNDLTLGSGRIVAGSIVIDKNGGYGGRLAASTLLFDTSSSLFTGALTATNGITSAAGDIVATLGDIRAPFGDIGGASKSFWIDHPTKPGKQLRHGSLEGPEHAVYYRGVVEFDEDGEAVFELPDYFEALVIEGDEPTVQITPIGRPFAGGAERVTDGRVTVYGERNREAHVTVTAARGLFDVEPDKD
jgi:hypothetical protein